MLNLFSLAFVQYALLACVLAGTALAFIGVFVLVNRISFSGLAVSQLAALGTVIGSFVSLHYGEFGLAIFLVGLGMFLVSRANKVLRVPPESTVASLYILGAGCAVLILSKASQGESHTLNIFFGNILSLSKQEVWESCALLFFTAVLLCVCFYRWIWISFDSVSAEVAGIRNDFWNFLFLALFTLGMTVSIHIFGALLAFTYLIVPATVGLLMTRRVRTLFLFIPLFTILTTIIGFYFSLRFDFPTGPFLACLMAGISLGATIVRQWKGG